MGDVIECPNCDSPQEIDYEDFPDTASETAEMICDDCGFAFKWGWRAVVEVRTYEPALEQEGE